VRETILGAAALLILTALIWMVAHQVNSCHAKGGPDAIYVRGHCFKAGSEIK
jgi:hypothetical protein